MSANWKRQLNITKKALTISPHIFQNFIASHTIPLQILFHTSLLLWPSSNYNRIRHFIIISYLFFIITVFIKISPLFYVRCSIFITDTYPPPSSFSPLLDTNNESLLLIFFSKQTAPLKRTLLLFNFCLLKTVGFLFLISVPE